MTSSESEYEIIIDNSGDGTLLVPGFNDIDIDLDIPHTSAHDWGHEGRFRHGINDFRAERLTVREVAMLQLMDAITDKANWHAKIFDETIVRKWHEEAIAQPLISEKTWEWVVTELRDKARDSEVTGFVSVYDTDSRVVKADRVVSEHLRADLINSVKCLLEVPEHQKDYHPNSNDQVLNLVHPSLFPLVYGKTLAFTEGGSTSLTDIYGTASSGSLQIAPLGPKYVRHADFWSRRFQWLPCEVAFTGERGTTDIKITSYINNLHPGVHQDLYQVIEHLVGLSIPLWDQVLIKGRHGRTPMRIITLGNEWSPSFPDWAARRIDPKENIVSVNDERFPEFWAKIEEYLKLPDREALRRDEEIDDQLDEMFGSEAEEDEDEDESSDEGESQRKEPRGERFARFLLRRLTTLSNTPSKGNRSNDRLFTYAIQSSLEQKFMWLREPAHPEPGTAVTYEQWKEGLQKPIISNRRHGRNKNDVPFTHFKGYDIKLEEQFHDAGLQVIVKLASIELSPEKPDYQGGNWHVEGMMNEHIVATAIYYYDVENVTDAKLSFRHEATLDDMDLVYEQDQHEGLEAIFGAAMRDGEAVQTLGSVNTPQGRLLVFPNTLQHAVQGFSLADKSKPGHRRFVVLWLVDPHFRICSTRNVPPQRYDWVGEKMNMIDFSKLPVELMEMIRKEVEDGAMGLDEAKELRLKLMKERSRITTAVEARFESYNLCEH